MHSSEGKIFHLQLQSGGRLLSSVCSASDLEEQTQANIDISWIESLEMVSERMKPFWENYIKDIKKQFENHMIIAHSNSLRAIVKILDNKTNEEITSLNIPTGVPLVYNFNENFNIESKEFLIDEEKLKLKQKEIANQGKIK